MVAEFALVVPVFLTIIFAIVQIGILFFANAGLKHSLGEAARYATLYPRRTDDQIKTRLQATRFGLDPQYLAAPVISHGVSQGTDYADISVQYTVHMDLFLFDMPVITLSDQRRAYLP